MTDDLEISRTYSVHSDAYRAPLRRCQTPGCLVAAKWSLRTTFRGGRMRVRGACFTHACEWARDKGIQEPRAETALPSIYVEE